MTIEEEINELDTATTLDDNQEPDTHADEEQEETAQDAVSKALDELNPDAEAPPEEEGDDQKAGDVDGDVDGGQGAAVDNAGRDQDIYAVPEGLSERGRERFQTLVENHKEISAQLEASEKARNEFVDLIRSTGAESEEFASALEFLRLTNSSNPADLKTALEMVESQRERLATALGSPLPGIDPLNDFPDLQEAVDTGEITQHYAEQLAMNRKRQAQQEAMSQQQQQRRVQHETMQAHEREYMEMANGIAATLNQLEAEWVKNDLHFDKKKPLLVRRVENIVKTTPPDQWLDSIKGAYEEITEAMKLTMQTDGGNRRRPRPLSSGPSGGSGGGTPNSAREAIDQALANLSGA